MKKRLQMASWCLNVTNNKNNATQVALFSELTMTSAARGRRDGHYDAY